MLQYITNTRCEKSVVDQVRAVLDGGCRWIQVRMKDASDEEIGKVIEQIKPWCLETEAFLLLDDRVELAKTLDVGGVHLGKKDMLPSKARMILGPAAVIGVTANSFEDIEAVRYLDIDYLGIGPFRFTETKKNLAPILGIEGLQQINDLMVRNEINIPRVAIGGIKLEDVEAVMKTGVNGIAVSGEIAFSDNIEKTTRKFVEALKPFEKTN